MSTVGYIVWPGGRLPITDVDLLWAARAAARETDNTLAGRSAVWWAWAQALVWRKQLGNGVPVRGQERKPYQLQWLIRGHSQPVNPYWRDRGDAGQVRARQYLQSARATWESLERGEVLQPKPNLKRDAYAWGRGQVPNPVPRLADFSAPGRPDVPVGAPIIHGNAFMAEPGPRGTANWPDNYVQIVPAGAGVAGFSPLVIGGIVLAAAATLIAAYVTLRPPAVANRRRRYRRRAYALAA